MPKRWFRLPVLALALAASASAQIAILQIRVVEGEGAVYAPGSRSPHPLTVEVTDESGKPVEDAAVSFHVPEDGPTGTFFNGLRTAVATTDASGRASLSGLILSRTSGRFEIRIVASREQARAGIVSFQYIAEPEAEPLIRLPRHAPPATGNGWSWRCWPEQQAPPAHWERAIPPAPHRPHLPPPFRSDRQRSR